MEKCEEMEEMRLIKHKEPRRNDSGKTMWCHTEVQAYRVREHTHVNFWLYIYRIYSLG